MKQSTLQNLSEQVQILCWHTFFVGLTLAGDHHPCNNETAVEECHSYAFCSAGGYCECNSGYKGDGKNDCKGNIRVCAITGCIKFLLQICLLIQIYKMANVN